MDKIESDKEKSIFSEKYLKWVKQADLPPLTNTQHRFAEWLLEKENFKMITQIGELTEIFKSIRKFGKENGVEQINRLHKNLSDLTSKINNETDEVKRGELAFQYYQLTEIWGKLDEFIEFTLKHELDCLYLD